MISNENKAEAKKLIEALIKKMESHIKKIKEAKESERVNPFDKYPLDGYLKKAEKLRENYIMAYKEIDKQDSDFDFKMLFKNKLKELPKPYVAITLKNKIKTSARETTPTISGSNNLAKTMEITNPIT